LKNCNVIVTGAAGFIGSHTVDRLLKEGHTVIGVDNLSTGNMNNLVKAKGNSRFHLLRADLMEPELMARLCREYSVDSIVHLAGLVSVVEAQNKPTDNFTLNLHATHIVGEAARTAGVRRVVFASSAATYGDCPEMPLRENAHSNPLSVYGSAKLASEMYLLGFRAYEMEVIFTRYFNVYGPRQDPKSPYSGVISIFSDRFSRGEAIQIFGDGKQTRDFISVFDVARANCLAATKEGSIKSGPMNICTGQSRELNEMVRIFQDLFPNSPKPIKQPFRSGEILESCGDPEYAAKSIGFRSEITLEQGIRQLMGVKEVYELV
jgi:UDP-glucose 4-epimerase